MAQQNINQYNFKKWYIKNVPKIFDISLASDEVDYNQEVVFSNDIIGINDGNILPIHFDLNNSGSSQLFQINYGEYNTANTLVSLNYYNPNNDDLNCFTATTLCDIGLTGIDNGLTTQISGETITFTMGLFSGDTKWDRYYYDRRLKLLPVRANTNTLVDFTLDATFDAGSIIARYTASASTQVLENVTIDFYTYLTTISGGTIDIYGFIIIPSGSTTGGTTVIAEGDYSLTTEIAVLSASTFNSDGSQYTFSITPKFEFLTPTPTPTVTMTSTVTPTKTVTPSFTPSFTPTNTNTLTRTPTGSVTPSRTPTGSVTPSRTPTGSVTPSFTPTKTVTPSFTPTKTVTKTVTPTKTLTKTPIPTRTPTRTPTKTVTSSNTPTPTRTPTNTVTSSNTPTPTKTPTNT